MELRELRYILQISKSGSLSKAADELFIAQSSLSNFLKHYESRLGYQLFIRTSQGLTLTYEGQVFLDYAIDILEKKRQLLNHLSDISNMKNGNIKFSISPYRAPYLLPLILPIWNKKYPKISVEVIEASMPQQEKLLSENKVDLGLIIPSNLNLKLSYKLIMEEEILIASHPSINLMSYAHACNKTNKFYINIEDIKNQPFLLYSVQHRLHDFAQSLFDNYSISPKVIQKQNSFETILRLANVGMGITFVPKSYVSFYNNLQFFSIGKKGEYRSLSLAYPPSGYRSKATNAFSDLIIKILSNNHD